MRLEPQLGLDPARSVRAKPAVLKGASRSEVNNEDRLALLKGALGGPNLYGATCAHRSLCVLMAPMTRGDILRYSIAFALRRAAKVVRGLRQGLSEDERYAVADHVVAQLRERGDPWGLNDEAKPGRGPAT